MTDFLRDEGQKRFCAFLVGILAIVTTVSVTIWAGNGYRVKKVALEHDGNVVSSLIDQGISEEVIAKAFAHQGITEEGTALLGRMGINEETEILFMPGIREVQKGTGAWLAGLFFFLWVSLLFLTYSFFSARERTYEQAIKIIERFMQGDFDEHLPRLKEGCLYRLFGRIDGLANALSAGNEEAVKAKNFLKDTISDISHQLKTPLSALSMYNEIIESEIESGAGTKETALEFIQKSTAALARINELIQALLKVTRLDAGAVVFEKQDWLLEDVVSRAVEELWVRAEEEGKEIVLKGADQTMVNCDLQWTGEAIGNLVKNALDYTNRGGKILVCWEETSEMTRVSVLDDGKGIEEKDLYHIFKRFYRSAGTKRSSQGAGLGLPLAKSVIEGQGGTLSVQSKSGEGTVFTIMLPRTFF
ncbi:MAG: HAMP domain-containing histidine kinase [Lachnospiraceae bacterium]|nr:HAMP domain-containing histidine kinase [Lachnospiraceae bacterium]